MSKPNLKDLVAVNRVGWEAIQHKDGWWVGTDKGVTCYRDRMLASAALTIYWQRDGGKQLNFRIKTFTGADCKTGEYTPVKSAAQALQDYEKRKTTQI
jgi:hypothetical protein